MTKEPIESLDNVKQQIKMNRKAQLNGKRLHCQFLREQRRLPMKNLELGKKWSSEERNGILNFSNARSSYRKKCHQGQNRYHHHHHHHLFIYLVIHSRLKSKTAK